MKKSNPTAGRIIRLVIATLSVVISVKVFSMIVGTGPNDYTYFIRPSTLSWLKGETNLFDQTAEGFYFMPWSVLLFAPTLLVPPEIGQGMLSVLTLVGVLMADLWRGASIVDKGPSGNSICAFHTAHNREYRWSGVARHLHKLVGDQVSSAVSVICRIMVNDTKANQYSPASTFCIPVHLALVMER